MNCEPGSSILNTDVYKIKTISNHRCGCLYEFLGIGLAQTLAVKGRGRAGGRGSRTLKQWQ